MNEIFPLLLLLGAFSGFIAGLLGIGGGIIIVPVLLYLLAPTISQSVLMHTVIGTTLAVTVFTSISSVYAHNRHGAILWKSFIKLMPTVLLGAFSGALIANFMSFDFLRIIFENNLKVQLTLCFQRQAPTLLFLFVCLMEFSDFLLHNY